MLCLSQHSPDQLGNTLNMAAPTWDFRKGSSSPLVCFQSIVALHIMERTLSAGRAGAAILLQMLSTSHTNVHWAYVGVYIVNKWIQQLLPFGHASGGWLVKSGHDSLARHRHWPNWSQHRWSRFLLIIELSKLAKAFPVTPDSVMLVMPGAA